MYVMKPILEPEIIDILNKDRFSGDLQGYILSDGGDLFGWLLFKIENDTTILLDVLAPDTMFMDGLIRATVAFGQERGATCFWLNRDIPGLKEYKRVFFEAEGDNIPNEKLFTPCGE